MSNFYPPPLRPPPPIKINVKRILCLKVVYVQGWDTPRLWRWLRNGPSWILPCPLKPLHNFKIHYFSIDQIKLATLLELVFRRTFLKPIFLSSNDCQMYLKKYLWNKSLSCYKRFLCLKFEVEANKLVGRIEYTLLKIIIEETLLTCFRDFIWTRGQTPQCWQW